MFFNKLKIPMRHIFVGVLHSTIYFLLTLLYQKWVNKYPIYPQNLNWFPNNENYFYVYNTENSQT